MATNRADTLDPALLRPGRLDRKIEFPLPDRRQKRLIFQVCPSRASVALSSVWRLVLGIRMRLGELLEIFFFQVFPIITTFRLTVHALPHGQVCTAKMNLSDEVDLEDYVSRPDKISAAEIAAICQEAGMHAVRKNRCVKTVQRALLDKYLILAFFADTSYFPRTLRKGTRQM